MIGLKKIDLSFNKLGKFAAFHISRALKIDSYLRALNLRSNQFDEKDVESFYENMTLNQSLLNLDLRDNSGFKTK